MSAQNDAAAAVNGSGRADAKEAFRRARGVFLAGKRIEMQNLATDLGVDRATLFRWVGNRDQLTSDVIWSLCLATLRAAEERSVSESPTERAVEVLTDFMAVTISSRPFGEYLSRERDRALRVLTSNATPFQQRLTDYIEHLIQECGPSAIELSDRDLAYTIVRIAEAFVYTDLITGAEPNADKGAAAIAALLGARGHRYSSSGGPSSHVAQRSNRQP